MNHRFVQRAALILFFFAAHSAYSQFFQLDYYLPSNFQKYGPWYGMDFWLGVESSDSSKYKLELIFLTFKDENYSLTTILGLSHAFSADFEKQRTSASTGLRFNYSAGLSGAYTALYTLYEFPIASAGDLTRLSDWNFALDLLGYDLHLPWLPLSLGAYWRTTLGLFENGPFMVGLEFGTKIGMYW